MDNKPGIRRNFARRAASYDLHAGMQRSMAQELLKQAGGFIRQARRILEIGCGTGYLTEQIRRANAGALVVALDLDAALLERARARLGADPRIAWLVADGETWIGGDFEVIISNASFQWLAHPGATLAAYHRSLAPGGVLAFSTLGPRTFQELGQSLQEAALLLGLTALPEIPAQGFLDQGNWKRLLHQAGFPETRLRRELVSATFPSVGQFLKDLQATGATNPRPRPFSSRLYKTLISLYRAGYGNNGSIPVTFEIIWALAQK